jgi:phosphoserine phosphatase RsbU/P
MAVMHSIAHAFPGTTISPSHMLNYLNDKLCQHYVGSSGTFVTAFYAIFDPLTRRLTYSSAGHNPPRWRLNEQGNIFSLQHAQHFPLGVTTMFEAVEASVELNPGDQLILYTDGIVEATNPDNELYGLGRLDQELSVNTPNPEEMIALILKSLEEFTDGAPPSDDRTIVIGTIS